jgi:hypothetical protein
VRLSRVQPGDIVLIGNGKSYTALVMQVARGQLQVCGVCNSATRWVKAVDVTDHWRHASSGRSRPAERAAA